MPDVLPDLLLRHRHARLFARALIVVLAFAILIVLAQLIWLLVAAQTATLPEPEPVMAPLVAADAPPPVSAFHLFGNATPALDPRGLAVDAPDTKLELTLSGIVAQDDPKQGYALVVDANGVQHVHAVGAEVAPGVTVDSIYADRVLLSRAGVLETLRLPRRDDAPAAPNASYGPQRQLATPRPASPLGAPATASANLPGIVAAQPFVNPNIAPMGVDLEKTRAALGVDPMELAKRVQILPVTENGRFVGVRLTAGRELPIIARLGLQPDDVVTSINGIALDGPARAQQIAESLKSAESASVTVRRNGKTETLSVSLR
ncbi:MAG TPA: type II secretion system protein GspC [Xanthomonadales bacterium]|nr:type II secretion system protein GspC [Xanthomonadales bacterium]